MGWLILMALMDMHPVHEWRFFVWFQTLNIYSLDAA